MVTREEATTTSRKTEYGDKWQARRGEFGAKIERLKARADKTEAGTQKWHHKQVEGLQEKHRMARKEPGELGEASDDAREDLKEGMSSAWASVDVGRKEA